MTSYREIEIQLVETSGIGRRPVAVAFLDAAPAGVERFQGAVPSGCSFWKLAAEGRVFCTEPHDHYNCPIGSHTHNIPLPEDRAGEMNQTLRLMGESGYLRMEEVNGIPRLPRTPAFILYAPLAETPVDPDAVIFMGRPGGLMLLLEAAARAGVPLETPAFGRPTCMALPAALTGGTAMSVGCIGNRIYTEIPDDELYLVIRGADLPAVAAEAHPIASANALLGQYHRERRRALWSA